MNEMHYIYFFTVHGQFWLFQTLLCCADFLRVELKMF